MNMIKSLAVSTFLCIGFPNMEGQQRPSKADPPDELYRVGEAISRAILNKDVATLLSYDRSDLRRTHEAELRDKKSELYCFLFDSSCVAGKRFPSVLEKLSQARQPGLKVFRAKSGNGTPIATIVYFDRATVPEQMIASVHCTEKGLRQLAEWRLELVDENWKGIVFNFGTDCS